MLVSSRACWFCKWDAKVNWFCSILHCSWYTCIHPSSLLASRNSYISKMYNSLEATTEQPGNSEQPHWSFQMLPDAPRCFQISWLQNVVLSGALQLLHQWSQICCKFRNRVQEYPEECIHVIKMLQNQTIRICEFWSNWKYEICLYDYASAPPTWSHTHWEWVLDCSYLIVRFN